MPVRQVDLVNGQPEEPRRSRAGSWLRRRSSDWSLLVGQAALWLAVVAFGGIIFVLNGGYSVMGLQVITESFHAAGRVFWAALAAITFDVPLPEAAKQQLDALALTQPLIPWLGVVAASILQVVVLYRKLRGLSVPSKLWVAASILSVYDLATTFFGLGTTQWIAQAGWLIQGLLAFFLTFVLEVTVSLLLRPNEA
jgi:hypothetical protein